MRSTFHPNAQRNAFRHRVVRLQSTSFAIGINRCDAAPTPTGFAEIVSDDFPELLHVDRIVPLLVSTQQSQNDMKGGAMTRASVLN